MGIAAPQQSGTACAARITVRTPDGRTLVHDVTPDDNLIVGSSANCSLQLESTEVAAMHCLIAMEHGRLTIQDWYTTAGTFVNGEKIQHPVSFRPGDEIRIGDFQLSAEFVEAVAEKPAKPSSRGNQEFDSDTGDDGPIAAGSFADSEYDQECKSQPHAAFESTPITSAGSTTDSDSPDAKRLQRELDSLRKQITDLEVENESLRLQSGSWGTPAGVDVDPFDAEMVDLLKSEVEQLQDEVAQRDSRIAELQEHIESGAGSHSDAEPSDTAALVERLEKLLEELQLSDERVATLEDLLRTADEATRAEQEERRQLGAWVQDIEERIGEYEAGWKADNEALQARVDELTEERQRFDQRLREISERQGLAAQAEMIEELRGQVDSLTEKLKLAEDARSKMREKIDSVEFQNSIENQEKRIEQRMREERLELAEEHSKLARERAELTRLKAEVDRNTDNSERKVDDATCRMQAFREHLKDLHKEEQKEKKNTGGGLSARLSRLWKRLDGR